MAGSSPLPPYPRQSLIAPLSQPSLLSILLRFYFCFLTTSFTSFDVHAFNIPPENISHFVRGNAPGAKAS